MYLVSTSMGNDSVALIQWAHEKALENVHVVYIDTGWAHPDWPNRVEKGMRLAKKYGFIGHIISGEFTFESMVLMKKGFPNQRMQFCSGLLKVVPFQEFAETIDPEKKATVIIGKRRAESANRAATPEFIEKSDSHEGRMVWHPLFKHTDKDRDELLYRAGFDPLPHRSMECCPCVNANRQDLRMTPESQLDKLRELEKKTGRELFRARRHQGAWGIDEVMEWAHSARGGYVKGQKLLWNYRGEPCAGGLCGM